MLVSLYTKLYMITCVNVEYHGSAKGYSDAFREAKGDDAFKKIHIWNEPQLGMFSIMRNVSY